MVGGQTTAGAPSHNRPEGPATARSRSDMARSFSSLPLYDSIIRLEQWIESRHYMAYEPFDGLSSPLNKLTFGNLFLKRLLMQSVRQSPINVRPILGIRPLPSTKGRGYMVAGYLSMKAVTGDATYLGKAVNCLEWLIKNKSPRYRDHSWANHFEFAGRGGAYAKDESIIVWTSLIGMAFVQGFAATGQSRYLDVAESACRWVLSLPRERTSAGSCLSYLAGVQSSIHNANMLGAALLAMTYQFTRQPELQEVASEALRYSCSRQRVDGSWWYAEDTKYHWIDNFHTGYNLDSLFHYEAATGDHQFNASMMAGLDFYKKHFFEHSGRPRYYHTRTQPVDSQCAAQSIETLSRFSGRDEESGSIANRVAHWAVEHMQDATGYFYYRAYPLLTAKAPMLHWAQATMYSAIALLLRSTVTSTKAP